MTTRWDGRTYGAEDSAASNGRGFSAAYNAADVAAWAREYAWLPPDARRARKSRRRTLRAAASALVTAWRALRRTRA